MRSEIKNFCWCICPILCPMPRNIHTCMLFFLISFILYFSYRWKIEYKKKRNVKFWNIVSISPCSQPPKKKWMRNQIVYMYVFQSDKVKYYTVLQTKYGPFVVFFPQINNNIQRKQIPKEHLRCASVLRAYTRKMMMMSFKETLKQYWMEYTYIG